MCGFKPHSKEAIQKLPFVPDNKYTAVEEEVAEEVALGEEEASAEINESNPETA